MKQIKFRSWDGFNKKMSFWTINDLCTWNDKTEKPSSLEDWMQYTGLLDKNGEEIYQLDQLRAKSNQTKENIEGIVEWRNDEAAFRLVAMNNYMYKLHDIHNVEVIGNIYQLTIKIWR